MKDNIGKKAVILSICNISQLLISMIISMMIARYRTLEENGTYAQVMLVVNTVIPLVTLGLPNSITFFLGKSKTKEERKHYLGVYYTAMSIICIGAGLILFALTPIISKYYSNSSLLPLSFVFLLLPFFLQITGTVSDVLICCDKVWSLLRYRLIYSSILLAINIAMVIFKWSFLHYMYIYLLALCMITIYVFIIIRKEIEIKKIFIIDTALFKQVMIFAVPMGIATLVGTLSIQFDKLFIASQCSTATLGMYNYMARELPIVAVTMSFTSILLPTITKMITNGEKEKSLILWKKSAIITYSIVCFFVTGVFIYAPQVIKILYSSKYLEGIWIFRIYTLSLLLRFTYFGIFFNCMGKSKKIMFFSTMGLGLNIVLNYLFYMVFGMLGPALATVTSIYAVNFLQLKGTAKMLETSMKNILFWKELFKISVLNIGLGVVFYLLQKIGLLKPFIGECPEAVVLAIIWGAIYYLILRKKIKSIWKELVVEKERI